MEKSKWSRQMEWKTMIILLFSTIFICTNINSQDYIIDDCVNRHLVLVDTNIYPKQLKECTIPHSILKNDVVEEWLETINKENLKVFILSNKKSEYIILSSTIFAATGLATNFYNWLLINTRTGFIPKGNVLSLSSNPNNFYIRDNVLNIIEYQFTEDFIHDGDYSNLNIIKARSVLKNNILKRIEISTLKCY